MTTVLDTKTKEADSKIHNLSGLVKKTDYDTKILEIRRKYFTTSSYNKFKSDILDGLIIKLTTLATKAELEA